MKLKSVFTRFFLSALVFLCLSSCGEEYSSSVYDANFNRQPADIINLTQSQIKDTVILSWKLPDDSEIRNLKIQAEPAHGNLETPKIIEKSSVFNVYGLQSNKSYKFTVYTVNKNGRESSGVSLMYRPNINSDLISYKYSNVALDFGYSSGSVSKSFVYTSVFDEEIDLSSARIEYISGTENVFFFENASVSKISNGDSTNITVSYSPGELPSWDESDLVLCEEPEVRIRLIASNFKQPSDIQGNHLRLWLRPDLISESDIDEYGKVKRLPDYSGNGFDAVEFDSCPPLYEHSVSSLNSEPAVFFEGIQRLKAAGDIVKAKEATTTFAVVQRTAASNGAHYFLLCSNGYSTSYPLMGYVTRYYDETSGTSTTQRWAPYYYGNGISGSYRFMFDDNESDDNTLKLSEVNVPQILCTVMDLEQGGSNIFAWLDGEKKLLSYTHSFNGKNYDFSVSGKNYDTNNGFAYGKPWSDGQGHLYKTLWNMNLEDSDENSRELYYQEHPDEHPSRPYDWALRWYYLRNVRGITTQGDLTDYFKNIVTPKKETMGTVSNVYLGASIVNSTVLLHNYLEDVIIYDTALTDEEIAEVSSYLKYRYGIGDE
ncbi:fibronectin type III domain-containing protein [Treponema sp.]|uniref:fibronectin type III domain-containing protein n=1 Tax=Treponema sp. TaxID=166 RepID=UPI00257EFF49|nr:fibronectin type III domain-containing protein [Treponema sp.]MBE6355209.1 DUF4959 domain-containing protein [Treponema sp.]